MRFVTNEYKIDLFLTLLSTETKVEELEGRFLMGLGSHGIADPTIQYSTDQHFSSTF